MEKQSVVYYELRKVEIKPVQPGEFRILTAAVLDCSLCGSIIDGMGGPGDAPVCVRCAEVLRQGRARGAIKWDDENTTGFPMTPSPDNTLIERMADAAYDVNGDCDLRAAARVMLEEMRERVPHLPPGNSDWAVKTFLAAFAKERGLE